MDLGWAPSPEPAKPRAATAMSPPTDKTAEGPLITFKSARTPMHPVAAPISSAP